MCPPAAIDRFGLLHLPPGICSVCALVPACPLPLTGRRQVSSWRNACSPPGPFPVLAAAGLPLQWLFGVLGWWRVLATVLCLLPVLDSLTRLPSHTASRPSGRWLGGQGSGQAAQGAGLCVSLQWLCNCQVWSWAR